VGTEEWGLENEEWRMENGEWRMENGGADFMDYGLRIKNAPIETVGQSKDIG